MAKAVARWAKPTLRGDRSPSIPVCRPRELSSARHREQRLECGFVVLPSRHRFCVDRLAHLRDARRSHGSICPVKIEACLFPLEAAQGDQAWPSRLEIRDRIFIADVMDRHRQDLVPMIHDTAVLVKPHAMCTGLFAQRTLVKSVIQQETATSRRLAGSG